MTKEQLKQWVEKQRSSGVLKSAIIDDLLSKIDQLDSPEPETIPFTWLIPPGYEPVTRDGRKVGQLVRFEVEFIHPIVGVIAGNDRPSFWGEDGHNVHVDKVPMPNDESLFLRKTAPEMVEAWVNCYPGDIISLHEAQEQADRCAAYTRIGPAIKVAFPKPKP